MRARWAVLALLLAARLGAGAAPLVSVLGTCSALTANTYPADSVNWFDASRHSQVIFYAHLLYPVKPWTEPWHAPLRWPMPAPDFVDEFYAEAEWLDPQGRSIALHGLTFPARIRTDWLRVNGADYVPHTLAMAIGTRDLRTEAGQTHLPDQVGQYTVRLRLNGQDTAMAFFRMLGVQAPAHALPLSGAAKALSPSAQ
jgi:hypothetical protein